MEYIGFTTKYYTLWNVETSGEWTTYTYVQNLSMDYEKARAKKPNALVDLSLKGHHSFRVRNIIPTDCFLFGKYKGEPLFEHTDDIDYMAWYANHVDNDSYKANAVAFLTNKGYKELNGKMYTEEEYKKQLILIERFPLFKAKVEKNETFRFIPSKNLTLGYSENDAEIATMVIPFCKIVFTDFAKKEYKGYNYCLPTLNGREVAIKGKRVVVDEYTAMPTDEEMQYEINIKKFHIEN